MFKKKPTIKPLSSLRSSDRRRIADQIIRDYRVEVPAPPPPAPAAVDTAEQDENTRAQASATSLAALRNSLLPENTQAGRFTTTAGPNLNVVSGTLYVGAYPDSEERVLWFKLEQGPGSDGRLYPTVYTLWRHPRIVPLLHTPALVMGKLLGGADLMTPGLANGPPFPPGAIEGAVVAVASLENPSVPTLVGVCEINIADLGQVQGAKGHAVRGVQWEGDELWRWSASGLPGQQAPDQLDAWLGDTAEAEQALDELSLEPGNETPSDEGEAEGGVSLGDVDELGPPQLEVEEHEPTTQEIDRAFDNAFIYVLHQHRNDNPSQPNHGLPLPIQPSFLISNLITPFLPIFSPQQAQYYQIKKTSWKNVKKFIKHLDKAKLVKSKDRSGGETVILDVDFNHRSVEEFVPYRLPKKSSSGAAAKSNVDGDTSADPSVGQGWDVKTLYKPSAKLVPHLFPSLSNNDPKNYYSSTDISNRLNDYIASQDPPIVSPSNRRLVNLNPLLANKVFASNSPSDLDVLSRGTVLRDALFKRIIEDPTLCIPHHALLRPGQTLDEVKPKPGALPKVTVTIERRSGNKVATRILGVETFGVVPQILADELQKKCASSTSVAQAVGSPKGIVEILVQGDHRRAVEQALGKRGVKPKWIDVVDKSQKKGGGR